MKPDDFCYWLRGFFELTKTDELTKDQIKIIIDHLDLVFKHTQGNKEIRIKRESDNCINNNWTYPPLIC